MARREGHVFEGEPVALDDAGRPLFNELMFGRRDRLTWALDLLISESEDLRSPTVLSATAAR